MKFRPPYPSPTDRWRQLRVRLAKKREPFLGAKSAEVVRPGEDWRLDLKGFYELPVESTDAPLAATVGGVIVYGANQLECAFIGADKSKVPTLDQGHQEPVEDTFASKPESQVHFTARWHAAMCREIGADEFDKFMLAWRQAHRDAPE